MTPTAQQLNAIAFIERTLPYLKFVGTTKGEASEFIALHLGQSKSKQLTRVKNKYSNSSVERQSNSKQMTDEERYETYIDSVSQNYLDDCCDSYGWSSEHKDIARRLHPFDEWKKNGG